MRTTRTLVSNYKPVDCSEVPLAIPRFWPEGFHSPYTRTEAVAFAGWPRPCRPLPSSSRVLVLRALLREVPVASQPQTEQPVWSIVNDGVINM